MANPNNPQDRNRSQEQQAFQHSGIRSLEFT